MKIGWRDIGHLAIIGTAGAVGVVATLAVVRMAEGPRHGPRVERTTFTVRADPGVFVASQYVLNRTEQLVASDLSERLADRVRARLAERAEAEAASARPRVIRFGAPGWRAGQPVIYLDGVRVASLDNLGAQDIAGVDVVKGDKAAERFGTEAGERGVILVTTKKERKQGAGERSEAGR